MFSKQRENLVYVQGQSHTLVFKPRYILSLTTFIYVRGKAKRIYKRRRKTIIDTKSRFVDNLTLEVKYFSSGFPHYFLEV